MRLLALALFFPALVFASDCSTVSDYKGMISCYENNANSVDKDLNRVYQETLKKAQNSDLKFAHSFIKSNQRNWLKLTNEFCDARAIASGDKNQGSFYATAVNSCFTDKSIARIHELKSFTCNEGDMASHCVFNE